MANKLKSIKFTHVFVGVIFGIVVFTAFALYDYMLYYYLFSLTISILFCTLWAFLKRTTKTISASFVFTLVLLALVSGWFVLTVSVSNLRQLSDLPVYGKPKLVAVNHIDENLNMDNWFLSADILDTTNVRDQFFNAPMQKVVTSFCAGDIESIVKNTLLFRDTTEIHTPWHGLEVFCNEYIGRQSIISNIDTLYVYKNAIYGISLTPKKKHTVHHVYVKDDLYSLVDTNEIKNQE